MSRFSESKERYVKRFGAIAMERGYITLEQLIEALAIQIREECEHESHRLVGAILFEQDILTGSQLQEIVNAVLEDRTE